MSLTIRDRVCGIWQLRSDVKASGKLEAHLIQMTLPYSHIAPFESCVEGESIGKAVKYSILDRPHCDYGRVLEYHP